MIQVVFYSETDLCTLSNKSTLGPVWWKTLATNATGVWRTRDDWHGGAADALKGAAFDGTVTRLRC